MSGVTRARGHDQDVQLIQLLHELRMTRAIDEARLTELRDAIGDLRADINAANDHSAQALHQLRRDVDTVSVHHVEELSRLQHRLRDERDQNRALADELKRRDADIERAEARYEEASRERKRLERQYLRIIDGPFWRYTRPVRMLTAMVRRLLALNAPPLPTRARPHEALAKEEARAKGHLDGLRRRLYGLGFTERPLAELEDLMARGKDPFLKAGAALELARWHVNAGTDADTRRGLTLLPHSLPPHADAATQIEVALIEAQAHLILRDPEAGRRVMATACNIPGLTVEARASLYLASATFEPSMIDRVAWINKAFDLYGLAPVALDPSVREGRLPLDGLRLATDAEISDLPADAPLVSVIMPVYNSEATVRTALESVLGQTWRKLEVVVVDDCSTDATPAIVEDYATRDPRVRLLRAPSNGGPYVARNLALQTVAGDLVTTHDADDWSHPETIARQVTHLLAHPSTVANMTQGWRTSPELTFYRRHNWRRLVTLIYPTFMFRREPVMAALGYWDSVRVGADHELIRRVEKVFGAEAVERVPTGPLVFQRHSAESLTSNGALAFPGHYMGARREYHESQLWFHKRTYALRYEFPQQRRPFPVPDPMRPDREVTSSDRRHFDVIIASDFRLYGAHARSHVEEIKAQRRLGLRTGLMQLSCYEIYPKRIVLPEVRELLDGDRVQMLVYGEQVSCDVLIVRHPAVLQEHQRYVPQVEAGRVCVVVDQTPAPDSDASTMDHYDVSRCREHLTRYVGTPGLWYPSNALIRRAWHERHGPEAPAVTLAEQDWTDIIDPDEWPLRRHPVHGPRVRIGRHSLDAPHEWPADAGDLRAVYPEAADYEVHVLGGATVPTRTLGHLPGNWQVHEPREVHPRDFLEQIDVLVYHMRADHVEPCTRVIVDAMAAGVPVILPPVCRPAFGEAAVYAEPRDVRATIGRLMADEAYYESQVTRAREYVETSCGYAVHASRLAQVSASHG